MSKFYKAEEISLVECNGQCKWSLEFSPYRLRQSLVDSDLERVFRRLLFSFHTKKGIMLTEIVFEVASVLTWFKESLKWTPWASSLASK